MAFGPIEILATIMIVVGIVKLITFIVNPKGLINFAKKFYAKPVTISVIAFILAIVVLYYLIQAGMTIVQIFAVAIFISLVMITKMAMYAQGIIKQIKIKEFWKKQWFLVIFWVVLLIWAIKELFFA